MTSRLSLLGLGACLIAAQPALGQARQEATSGRVVERRTQRLMKEIAWKSSRKELAVAAAKSKKMVFWLQLVGKLDDGL